ncbi:MAG: NAD-binding protein [Kyrpidia sp.]|nr:NAD-binding protein [Kyrpidia sp.]
MCVVGAGHIGQHVLTHLHRTRPADSVTAVDIDPKKVTALRERGFSADTTCPEGIDVDVWIICVSTGPNLAWLFQALDRLSPKPGSLVSIESTLPVGTTRAAAARFRSRGYAPGTGFHLIHVPHRVLFGVDEDPEASTRIIAGLTDACLRAGIDFYSGCGITLHPVSCPELAELAKLVENSARYLEIAFAEALKQACDEHGLDFDQLRQAVNTKSNVHLADVDYGIGGECLPKDLDFLQDWLRSPLLGAAEKTDRRYRRHLVDIASTAKTALLVGLTYKPGVPVVQGSRAIELGRQLKSRGLKVYARDPLLKDDQVAELGFTPYRGAADIDVIYWRGKWETKRRLAP